MFTTSERFVKIKMLDRSRVKSKETEKEIKKLFIYMQKNNMIYDRRLHQILFDDEHPISLTNFILILKGVKCVSFLILDPEEIRIIKNIDKLLKIFERATKNYLGGQLDIKLASLLNNLFEKLNATDDKYKHYSEEIAYRILLHTNSINSRSKIFNIAKPLGVSSSPFLKFVNNTLTPGTGIDFSVLKTLLTTLALSSDINISILQIKYLFSIVSQKIETSVFLMEGLYTLFSDIINTLEKVPLNKFPNKENILALFKSEKSKLENLLNSQSSDDIIFIMNDLMGAVREIRSIQHLEEEIKELEKEKTLSLSEGTSIATKITSKTKEVARKINKLRYREGRFWDKIEGIEQKIKEDYKTVEEDKFNERVVKDTFNMTRFLRQLTLYSAGFMLGGIPQYIAALALIVKVFTNKKAKQAARKRIIRELELELKMVVEKIDDAKSSGDTKNKYKLMRLENELEKSLDKLKYSKKAFK